MRFISLGVWVAAHPRWVLVGWVAAIALGAWGAAKLPGAALGGTAGIDGSSSKAAIDELGRQFSNPFLDPLLVAVSSPRQQVDSDAYLAWLRNAASALAKLPEVRRVSSYADAHDAQLRSKDAHLTMLLVGLAAADTASQQRAVVVVRSALAPLRTELLRLDPEARLAVTGGPAANVDVNTWSAVGGDRAEKRALPLTLGILIVAFGTVIAAGLPFLMGLATTTIALGIAFVLASLMPVSNLLGNVVTMIGLAIGIDYSLLMVTHYRERASKDNIAEAVAATVGHAGLTISWSGLTVMIGLLGLLFSPILETRSVGIGGALVVCVSVLAALTLLPATLVILGPYIERWPIIPGRAHHATTIAFWQRLGGWIVRHPLPTLLVSGGAVIVLALPVLQARSGFTNEPWFLARGMESRIGAEMLAGIRSDNAALPIYAIVRATDGQPILSAAHLGALVDYADRLERDGRIAAVASPVTLQKGLSGSQYAAMYQDIDQALRQHPAIGEFFLSRDRQAALFEITPANGLAVKNIQRLAH